MDRREFITAVIAGAAGGAALALVPERAEPSDARPLKVHNHLADALTDVYGYDPRRYGAPSEIEPRPEDFIVAMVREPLGNGWYQDIYLSERQVREGYWPSRFAPGSQFQWIVGYFHRSIDLSDAYEYDAPRSIYPTECAAMLDPKQDCSEDR